MFPLTINPDYCFILTPCELICHDASNIYDMFKSFNHGLYTWIL